MNFPTADEVAYSTLFLRLSGIHRRVTEARPELTDLSVVTGPKLALTIDLPASPSGAHNRVVLARGRGYVPYWAIVGSRGHDLVSTVWGVETAGEQLRDALLATYDACLAKCDIASPWRWAEPLRSMIVRVADGLTKCGLDVEGVVSANRLIRDQVEGAANPRWVPEDFGDALRIRMRWGVGTLARKTTLGWVLDANNHLVTRRVDLARHATGTISHSPGLATDDVDLLVQAVARAVEEAEWDPAEGRITPSDTSDSARPLDSVAAWWLRELGYSGVEAGPWHEVEVSRSLRGLRGPLHVVTTGKRCGLVAVKCVR